ncbi:MAG: NFACT RNA binding domain-containing protein [Oligoflexales bacterium]
MLRMGKSWQCQPSGMTWQIKDGAQKGYLVLYAQGQAEFVSDKPKNLVVSGGFVAQIRKHFPSGFCLWVHKTDREYWFALSKHPQADVFAFLRLDLEEQELSFILSDKTQLVRLTPKGTYTHKKTWEKDVPQGGRPMCEIFSWEDLKKTEEVSGQKDKIENLPEQNILRKKLKRKVKTLKISLKKAEQAYEQVCDLDHIEKQARLLQMYAWKVQTSSGRIDLNAEETGQGPVCLSLKYPEDVGRSVEYAFQTFKKARRTLDVASRRKVELLLQVESCERSLQCFEGTLSWDDLLGIGKKYGLDFEKKGKHEKYQVQNLKQRREFISSDGIEIIVGRNAEENDQITAQAKSSDWWFHIAEGKGSHVIVRGKKGVELPEKTKQQALMLAVHFSDRRRDLNGDVYVLRRFDLMKSRDRKTGRWEMRRAVTSFVRYQEQDLACVLGSYGVVSLL